MLALSLLLAFGPKAPPPIPAGSMTSELVVEGPLAQRLSKTPADLVIFYGAEQKGSMETCGCPHRPRGSLARWAAYVDAAGKDVASVRVNADYWLEDAMGFEGATRPDVALMDQWMAQALALGSWDALNVGPNDLAGLASLPTGAAEGLPLVSATVSAPGVRPYVIVERGGRKVGITGIAGAVPTLTQVPGAKEADPNAILDELVAKVDVVVLLAYQAEDLAANLVGRHPEIDVVVDAAGHREFEEPTLRRGTTFVYAHYQTMRAGELRLRLDGGRIVGGVDRKVDLDPEMPDEPKTAALARQAKTEIDAAQKQLYGP